MGLVACAGVSPLSLAAEPTLRIAFINPDRAGNPFWDKLTSLMQAAATRLNIDLQVYYAGTGRFQSLSVAEQALQAQPKPDYLVYIAQAGTVAQILAAAEAAKVHSFILNTDLLAEDRARVGAPREQFRYWIGHMFPDDVQAGAALATALAGAARSKGARQPIEMIALSGTRDSSAALDRGVGLEQVLAKNNDMRLNQLVFAGWDPQEAFTRTVGLLRRYPLTRVLWAASDAMALRMIDAARQMQKTPGRDVFIGGVDWSDDALAAIAKGDLSASVGGHFMDGAWAMVLLYDYHNGKDFASALGSTIRSPMQVIDAGNVATQRKLLLSRRWDTIDFRQFSRVFNPSSKQYDFGLKALAAATRS
ncbi:ABC transporter substrate-binding protein [Curvibacter sp. APW13]|uniref:ABC transporter substrate-binding protein n=1 Tax=Curvibacter sp. APW13 TaxID=3077236 RepID=UPI0028DFCF50|nr:ABC transporter substrate-binding protein [Curvibacter sp. APW13]MDT8992415.1 ABC transporter substrate-binding protein [Curvibacter sp. APW13]